MCVKIVIVDDSVLVRKSVRELLCEDGDFLLVGEAQCIDDGLRIIVETKPDVVILDIVMSGGSGLVLLRRLKSLGLGCKVIMLSNQANEQIRNEAFALGADRFLDKAFEFEKLVDAVRG